MHMIAGDCNFLKLVARQAKKITQRFLFWTRRVSAEGRSVHQYVTESSASSNEGQDKKIKLFGVIWLSD